MEDKCPDCGSSVDGLRALNSLASALLDRAMRAGPSDFAVELVADASALVPSTEGFESKAAQALERAGRPDLAIVRIEAALAIAPRSAHLIEQLERLRETGLGAGRRPPLQVYARWAVLAVPALVLVAGLALILPRWLTPTPVATSSPAPSGVASGPSPTAPQAATSGPSGSVSPTASSGPEPTSTPASPTPTFPEPTPDAAASMRAALAANATLANASVAVEQVDGVLRIAGRVPDHSSVTLIRTLAAAAAPHLGLDLSLVIAPVPDARVVRRGDTLWSIAAEIYGDTSRWKAIAAENPWLRPHSIPIGAVIQLPALIAR